MPLMRVLLVEDDRDLSDFVREGLSREGFIVDITANGDEAVRQVNEVNYDVVLLDVMLPGQDGFSVLKTLRSKGFKGAILLATSKGHERDKLQGLNGGADDYIVKPFLLTELVARIRAVLRRTDGHHPSKSKGALLKVGDLQMDLLKHEVTVHGKRISLTKTEFDLLECFMRRPGQVLSQTILSQQVIHSDIHSNTNVIEVHIKNIRSKIDKKSASSLIRTVRGCGYALDA